LERITCWRRLRLDRWYYTFRCCVGPRTEERLLQQFRSKGCACNESSINQLFVINQSLIFVESEEPFLSYCLSQYIHTFLERSPIYNDHELEDSQTFLLLSLDVTAHKTNFAAQFVLVSSALNLRCPHRCIQSGRRIEPHLSLLRMVDVFDESNGVIRNITILCESGHVHGTLGVSYDQPMMRNYGLWIGHPAQPSWECYVLAFTVSSESHPSSLRLTYSVLIRPLSSSLGVFANTRTWFGTDSVQKSGQVTNHHRDRYYMRRNLFYIMAHSSTFRYRRKFFGVLTGISLKYTHKPLPKMSQDLAEQNIQMWKVKKLTKHLDSARGWVVIDFTMKHIVFTNVNRAGTSMISLIIPPE